MILAAGFNAHSQLSSDTDKDVSAWIEVGVAARSGVPADVTLVSANWSQTIYRDSNCFHIRGHDAHNVNEWLGHLGSEIAFCFGNDHQIFGALDQSGRVYHYPDDTANRKDASESASKSLLPGGVNIRHVAIAGNEQVAVVYDQHGERNILDVFPDYTAFRNWTTIPLQSQTARRPPRSTSLTFPHVLGQHFLPAPVEQLLANEIAFTILADGKVYTLGDARHPSTLGRTTTDTPASEPALVQALDGIRVIKLVSCGFMSGALAADGAIYLWGRTVPGSGSVVCEREIGSGDPVTGPGPAPGLEGVLRGYEGEDVALVQISNVISESVASGERADEAGLDVDFVDLAMGAQHILVLAADGRVFGIGSNESGQLGLGAEATGSAESVRSWTQVASEAAAIVAGTCSSLLVMA